MRRILIVLFLSAFFLVGCNTSVPDSNTRNNVPVSVNVDDSGEPDIVVSVILETFKQVESQLMMRNYDRFVK